MESKLLFWMFAQSKALASNSLDGSHGKDICYCQHVKEKHGLYHSGKNTNQPFLGYLSQEGALSPASQDRETMPSAPHLANLH